MPRPRRRLDIEALLSALTEKKVRLGISWREAARQAGISAPIFSRLRDGKQPDVNTFGALIRWLDLPAERFMAEPEREDDLPRQLRSLTKDKELSPKAKATVEELIRLIYRLVAIVKEDRGSRVQHRRSSGRGLG